MRFLAGRADGKQGFEPALVKDRAQISLRKKRGLMKGISKFIYSLFFKKTISEEMIREVKRKAEALYFLGHSIKQPTEVNLWERKK